MASVTRTQHGTWSVRYRDPTGRQRRRTFKRRADALAFRSQVETALHSGTFIDHTASRVTFADWSARWLDARKTLKPKTLDGYESLLRTHILPHFGPQPLYAIDPIDVDGWAGALAERLSPSRVRQAHQLLSAILKAAVRSRRLGLNPAEGTPLPKARHREKQFLDSDQVAHLAATVPDRYRTLVFTLAYGGLRWAEAVGLTRRRVNFLRRRLEITETLSEVRGKLHRVPPKNHQRREVTLPAFVLEELSRHIGNYVANDHDSLVFTTGAATPLRSSNFRKNVWLLALEEAGLQGLRVHDLRHTCASLLVSEGAHPRQVMAHLGHSSIRVTMDTYASIFPADMDGLAERLDRRHREAT